MINKLEIQKVLNKYYLSGLVESVKWTIESNKLEIDFQSPSKEMIGRINYNNFPLPDAEIAVYDTSKLSKLLDITSGDLMLDLEKQHKVYTKLNIADSSYNLSFSLTDLLLIQDVGNIKDKGDYDVEGELDDTDILAIIKAQKALESEIVLITPSQNLDGQNVLTFTFGDNNTHANKITYDLAGVKNNNPQVQEALPFNSSIIQYILQNNKDAESSRIKVNLKGYIKFEFEGEDWKSYYYIVRKTEY